MDTKEIRRSSVVNGIGYLFLTIYIFITLSGLKGMEVAAELKPAFFIGFSVLTLGSFIANREHKYFNACFISFICLDIVILGFIVFGVTCKYISIDASAYKLAMNIITACMNAGLALSNGLYVNGIKELYGKKKNKKMYAYCLVIEYGVTGLLLFSTIQSFIDFGASQVVGIGLDIALNSVIYLMYAIFMFVVFHTLKKQKDK